jgi:DNA-binding transcriptional MerR regulator
MTKGGGARSSIGDRGALTRGSDRRAAQSDPVLHGSLFKLDDIMAAVLGRCRRVLVAAVMVVVTMTVVILPVSSAFEASRMHDRRKRMRHVTCQRHRPACLMSRQRTMLLYYTPEIYSDDDTKDNSIGNERQKLINLVHFLREMGITIDEYETMIELLEDRQEELLQRACAIEELLETLSEVEKGSANMERDHAAYFAAKFQAVWGEEQLDGDEEEDDDKVLADVDDTMDTNIRTYVSVYPTDVSQLYGQSHIPRTKTPASSSFSSIKQSSLFMYKLQNASPQKKPQKIRKIVHSFMHRMKRPSPCPPQNPPNIVNFLVCPDEVTRELVSIMSLTQHFSLPPSSKNAITGMIHDIHDEIKTQKSSHSLTD